MDIETITKLLDAGYTKDEISAMQAGDVPEGEGAQEADNKTEPEGDDKKDPEEIDVNKSIAALTETVNSLTETVKALQSVNVKGAQTDSPKAGDKIKSAIDSFIESM